MTASDILEAQIDRMTQEIDRQAREITRYRVGIAEARDLTNDGMAYTAKGILDDLLDPGPAARGETPLLEVE
jgi:hypothetical protein